MSLQKLIDMVSNPDPAIDEFGRKYYKIPELDSSSIAPHNDERVECRKSEANLVSSELYNLEGTEPGCFQKPVIDIDLPCRLVESSTPGHFHLYIDSLVDKEKYFAMLDAMAAAGVVEKFYAEAARLRGATFVRVPWVKKSSEPCDEVTS